MKSMLRVSCKALLLLLLFAAVPVEARPFLLPIAARVVETSAKDGGWAENGTISVTFVQSEGNFKSAMAQSGWKFIHKVSLGGRSERCLYAWRKGSQELTLMLWRIDVGKTGFSWGVSKQESNMKSKEMKK